MATLSKPKIRVKASDLKKAILKKNRALESRNNVLESSLKDKEKELKFLEKEYNSETKKLTSLSRDVQFEEEKVQKIKGGVYLNEKLLSERLKKVDKIEKKLCEYESTVEKLKGKEKRLLDKIVILEIHKSKCEDAKAELTDIHAKKDNLLDEIDSINSDIKLSVEEGKNKISYYEGQYDALEEKAKKHEDMVYQFEQRLIETQDLFRDEENKLKDLLTKSKQASDEQQAIKNLCNNTEDEYIMWEQKVIKAKSKVDKEEDRNKKAKENFDKWRAGVLEEVARLKLKSKIDNIDKEGLSNILNNT